MASVEDVAWKLLGIFRAYNLGVGDLLKFQTHHPRTFDWSPPEKRMIPQAWDWLVEQGYAERIEVAQGACDYKLTDEGEKRLYGSLGLPNSRSQPNAGSATTRAARRRMERLCRPLQNDNPRLVRPVDSPQHHGLPRRPRAVRCVRK